MSLAVSGPAVQVRKPRRLLTRIGRSEGAEGHRCRSSW